MDISSREDSYLQWKSNKVQVIVATKAFGMGIDKADIRHVLYSGLISRGEKFEVFVDFALSLKF